MTSEAAVEVLELPRIYRVGGANKVMAILALVAAGGLTLFAMLGFAVALVANVGQSSLHMATTVPLIIAFGLFAAGIKTLRSPREIRITEDGVELHGSGGVRVVPWEKMSFSTVSQTVMGFQQQLLIFGADAKAVVKISGAFEHFSDLKETIEKRLKAAPAVGQSRARLKRARKIGVGLMVFGVCALALGGATFWLERSEQEAARLLKEKGVAATATITEKAVAPDGWTHRLYYRVTDANGKSDTANVHISTMLWNTLEVGQKIPVMAVPGRPDISHYAEQIDDDKVKMNPTTSLWMSVGISGFAVFCFVMGVMSFRGIDIDVDSKKGIRIQRIKVDEPAAP